LGWSFSIEESGYVVFALLQLRGQEAKWVLHFKGQAGIDVAKNEGTTKRKRNKYAMWRTVPPRALLNVS